MSFSAAVVPTAPATVWPPTSRWIGTRSRPRTEPTAAPTWLAIAGATLVAAGGVVAAAKFGPALLRSHSTGATIAKLGLGAVGVASGAALLASCAGTRKGHEYLVHFATEPDLSGVPEGEVYNVLRAHHERNAPALESALAALKAEGKVTSYAGIVGSNGFVITVARGHDEEVKARLAAVPVVGEVEAADLG